MSRNLKQPFHACNADIVSPPFCKIKKRLSVKMNEQKDKQNTTLKSVTVAPAIDLMPAGQ